MITKVMLLSFLTQKMVWLVTCSLVYEGEALATGVEDQSQGLMLDELY